MRSSPVTAPANQTSTTSFGHAGGGAYEGFAIGNGVVFGTKTSTGSVAAGVEKRPGNGMEMPGAVIASSGMRSAPARTAVQIERRTDASLTRKDQSRSPATAASIVLRMAQVARVQMTLSKIICAPF